MIELSKINGVCVFVNPDLVRFIEATPDTMITFTDGHKLLVKEKPQDIIAKILQFRRQAAQLPQITGEPWTS